MNSSFIVDVAMGQIPRSTERIFSVKYSRRNFLTFIRVSVPWMVSPWAVSTPVIEREERKGREGKRKSKGIKKTPTPLQKIIMIMFFYLLLVYLLFLYVRIFFFFVRIRMVYICVFLCRIISDKWASGLSVVDFK